ncbi:MAG: hypothetical protein JW755_03180 [Candidatus Aminicenantes bacterium]|nr:hypothetical protein [Candidatus Aminicenantes bacterium]
MNVGFRLILAFSLFCIISPIKTLSRTHTGCEFSFSNISIQERIDAKGLIRSYFESKGFETGRIKIPELNVEILLKEDQFYKLEDDIVDVYQRINEIRGQFGLPVPYNDHVQGYGWCGVFEAECSKEKAFGYVILVNESLNEASMIYTRAHENGHFLRYIDKQDLIYQKFKNSNHIKNRIHTDEDFSDLCGWIALKKAGYDLNDCFVINIDNPEEETRLARLRNLVRNYLLE